MTQINEDLSSITVSEDGLQQLVLGSNNPFTLEQFKSESEVLAVVNELRLNQKAWTPVPTVEELLQQEKQRLLSEIAALFEQKYWCDIPCEYENDEQEIGQGVIQFRKGEPDLGVLTALSVEASLGGDVIVLLGNNDQAAFTAAEYLALVRPALALKSGIKLYWNSLRKQIQAATDESELPDIGAPWPGDPVPE